MVRARYLLSTGELFILTEEMSVDRSPSERGAFDGNSRALGGSSLSQSRTEPSHVHLWTRIGVAPSPSSSSIVGLGQLGHRRSRRRGLLVISQQQSEQESRTSLVCVYFG